MAVPKPMVHPIPHRRHEPLGAAPEWTLNHIVRDLEVLSQQGWSGSVQFKRGEIFISLVQVKNEGALPVRPGVPPEDEGDGDPTALAFCSVDEDVDLELYERPQIDDQRGFKKGDRVHYRDEIYALDGFYTDGDVEIRYLRKDGKPSMRGPTHCVSVEDVEKVRGKVGRKRG